MNVEEVGRAIKDFRAYQERGESLSRLRKMAFDFVASVDDPTTEETNNIYTHCYFCEREGHIVDWSKLEAPHADGCLWVAVQMAKGNK